MNLSSIAMPQGHHVHAAASEEGEKRAADEEGAKTHLRALTSYTFKQNISHFPFPFFPLDFLSLKTTTSTDSPTLDTPHKRGVHHRRSHGCHHEQREASNVSVLLHVAVTFELQY